MIRLSLASFARLDRPTPLLADSVSQFDPSSSEPLDPESPLGRIRSGQTWIVNNRRRNGLILVKEFYAEFAGPGAAVGGAIDSDCYAVIPLGDFELLEPKSVAERKTGYLTRLQWLKLIERAVARGDARQRSRKLLDLFEEFFDRSDIEKLPDLALAAIVGVIPKTVRMVRHGGRES